MTVLYITQNGVTDHIGRSQVAPYVLGLAAKGFRIHVLSAEKEGQDTLIAEYQRLFDLAGVAWTRVNYRNRPPVIGQMLTQAAMKRAARRIIKSEGIKLLHCRSFPPTLIAHVLKRKMGIKYVFDFRDFYADGGMAKSRGVVKLAYKRLKQLEGAMIRDADKIVCLTRRAREKLIDWYLRDVPDAISRFQVIPCCADFSHFDPNRVSPADMRAARLRAGLREGETVLVYLGSLGPDYLLSPMIALFRQLLSLRPNSRFLFVSNNGQNLVDAELARQGIDPAKVSFVSADRNEVPAFLAISTFSVVFIRADVSKIGCSPTKLAELYACNVPVIANAGVGDMNEIIDPGRNKSILVRSMDDGSLRKSVEEMLDLVDSDLPVDTRGNSREFALEEGVARYAAVYTELLNE